MVEKVPLLGDIPVVGRLFQYKSKSKSKTNLMIFLHPVILRDAETAERVSSSKYDELRTRRMLADKLKANQNASRNDKEIPEIKLFHSSSNSRYQQVPSGSIDSSLLAPELEVVNKEPELEVVNKEPEWVELPDGSLVLR